MAQYVAANASSRLYVCLNIELPVVKLRYTAEIGMRFVNTAACIKSADATTHQWIYGHRVYDIIRLAVTRRFLVPIKTEIVHGFCSFPIFKKRREGYVSTDILRRKISPNQQDDQHKRQWRWRRAAILVYGTFTRAEFIILYEICVSGKKPSG